jgi:hypothetical protein
MAAHDPTAPGVSRPFRRTYLQFTDGQYAEGGRARYVVHPAFATMPQHYTRAFSVIQKDLITLFDYVEPADENLGCYSFRMHELYMRAAIEVEANLKAILFENGYSKPGRWTIRDYALVEHSHHLSAYETRLPTWRGTRDIVRPFADWGEETPPVWYREYNAAKHDRQASFSRANLENLLAAVSALVVLLSAQFGTEDFSPNSPGLLLEGYSPRDGFDDAIGSYFRVKWPTNIPPAERYNFDWQGLSASTDPVALYDYNARRLMVNAI